MLPSKGQAHQLVGLLLGRYKPNRVIKVGEGLELHVVNPDPEWALSNEAAERVLAEDPSARIVFYDRNDRQVGVGRLSVLWKNAASYPTHQGVPGRGRFKFVTPDDLRSR